MGSSSILGLSEEKSKRQVDFLVKSVGLTLYGLLAYPSLVIAVWMQLGYENNSQVHNDECIEVHVITSVERREKNSTYVSNDGIFFLRDIC